MDYILFTQEGKTFYPNGKESHNYQILDFDHDTNHTDEDVIIDYICDNPKSTTGIDSNKIQFAYIIDKETFEALENVVNYLYKEEKKYKENEKPENHIFKDLETLAYYIDKDYRELGTFD